MKSGSPRPRRRWLRRSLITVLVLANLVVFGGLIALTMLEGTIDDTVTTDPDVVAVLDPRPDAEEAPITFLVIGSDSREGLEDLTHFGAVEGARADVIMLLKVYPGDDHARLLSLPRDLWVDIPGHGKNRLNAAYAFGGATLMAKTVQEVTGLPVHHYVEVDFLGFEAIVDRVGGIPLDFPFAARDLNSGLRVDAGHQTLDGEGALAYARSRHYEELHDGGWVPVEADDIGRTKRQQLVLLRLLGQLKRPSNLADAQGIVTDFASHLTVDSALAESSIVKLAFSLRGLDGPGLETATLPADLATIDGASVLLARQPQASQLMTAFGTDQVIAAAPTGPLRLQVLNGNGIKGSAGQWSDFLNKAGFAVTEVGDADRKDFTVTTIIVRPEALPGGQTIAEALGFGTVTTGTVAEGFDAVVIMGTDAP